MSNINTKSKEFSIEVDEQSAVVFANLIRQQLMVGGECWRVIAFKFDSDIPTDNLQIEKVLNGTRIVVNRTDKNIIKFNFSVKDTNTIYIEDLEKFKSDSGESIEVVGTHNIYTNEGNIESNRKEVLARLINKESNNMSVIVARDNGYKSSLNNTDFMRRELGMSDKEIATYSIMNTYHRLFSYVGFTIQPKEDSSNLVDVHFKVTSMTSSQEELDREFHEVFANVSLSLNKIANTLSTI